MPVLSFTASQRQHSWMVWNLMFTWHTCWIRCGKWDRFRSWKSWIVCSLGRTSCRMDSEQKIIGKLSHLWMGGSFWKSKYGWLPTYIYLTERQKFSNERNRWFWLWLVYTIGFFHSSRPVNSNDNSPPSKFIFMYLLLSKAVSFKLCIGTSPLLLFWLVT